MQFRNARFASPVRSVSGALNGDLLWIAHAVIYQAGRTQMTDQRIRQIKRGAQANKFRENSVSKRRSAKSVYPEHRPEGD